MKNRIISFHSFKGGVGSSQLLANLSAYICYRLKKRVLIIDWNLQSSGIDKFFKESDFSKQRVKNGLFDIFKKYVDMVTTHKGVIIQEEELPNLYSTANEQYIYNLINEGVGVVDFVPASNNAFDTYAEINRFDWQKFYNDLQGRYFIEVFKRHLHELPYDFVLMDCQNGISDQSAICDIQLPDINVLPVVPTHQSIEGTKFIVGKIAESSYTCEVRKKPVILPLLSRIDASESIECDRWKTIFSTNFRKVIEQSLIAQGLSGSVSDYVKQTCLYYDSKLAFGENVIFSPNGFVPKELHEMEYAIVNIYHIIQNSEYDDSEFQALLKDEGTKQLIKDLAKKYKPKYNNEEN